MIALYISRDDVSLAESGADFRLYLIPLAVVEREAYEKGDYEQVYDFVLVWHSHGQVPDSVLPLSGRPCSE